MPKAPAQQRSLRRRIALWRARYSIPALLATTDEERVISALAATHGGLAIVTISVCAWLTNLPLLFPSLGPSAFILFTKPFSPDAAPRSVVMGHCTAIIAGLIVRIVVEALSGTVITMDAGELTTYLSASLALCVTCFLLVRLSVSHAPACATAIIVAVGGVRDPFHLVAMGGAVLMLTIIALACNRLAGVYLPAWRHRST